jgi:hypothetical protein
MLAMATVATGLYAQQAAKTHGAKAGTTAVKKAIQPNIYLGQSTVNGGQIQKDKFNLLLKQGLTSKDSAGLNYKVIGFDFVYAERRLYETENADLVMLTDMSSESCHGNTLNKDMTENSENFIGIYDRVKPGDTVYFDRVKVVKCPTPATCLPDSTAIIGKGMRFVIVK